MPEAGIRLSGAVLFLVLAAPWPALGAPTATTEFVTAASKPTDIVHARDARLFIVEQDGLIRIYPDGGGALTTFLDISDRVSAGFERGLLSMAFHPEYAQNGLFYVSYTDTIGDSVVARYSVSGNPDVADPNTARIIFGPIPQPDVNHNGGRLQWNGGWLWLGLGDGGGAGDAPCNAQQDASLLGKLLRIDADAQPVTVEVVAKGLRNPWRFSFDRETDDLYIGDVGQKTQEEIDFHPAGTPPGRNYGWKVMEGTFCHDPDPIDPDCPAGTPSCFDPAYTPPVATYPHNGECSVTGGYVYRGIKRDPFGYYFYGDFCSGQVWSLRQTAPGVWESAPLLDGGSQLRTFGEDVDGELYAAFGNSVVRFVFDGPDRIPVPTSPGAWSALTALALLAALAYGIRTRTRGRTSGRVPPHPVK